MSIFSPLPEDRVEYSTANAFHGTSKQNAESICAQKRFVVPTQSSSEMRFGPGIYFWENSRAAARKWAQVHHRGAEWGIVRAEVCCSSILDLLTTEHYGYLQNATRLVAQRRGVSVAQVTHSAVLSLLKECNLIDGVRAIAATHPNTMIHQQSKLAGPFDVILCVYEPKNIVVTHFEDKFGPKSVTSQPLL